MAAKFLTVALAAAVPALARTDLSGCTTYDTVVSDANGMYATRIWYVPDSGEICDILDCGGGRAPPKTTVPGCPAYEGTETYSPQFINPKTLGLAPAEETGDAGDGSDVSVSATITSAPASQTATKSIIKPIYSPIIQKPNNTMIAAAAAVSTPGHASLTTSTSSGAGAGTASSGSDSGSASDADSASTPAPAVSTAGASMPTAGAFLALAGAAIYAGML
ncbi:hypothetical protein ACLX1H_003454 [Fusarium chlamydosporum]